MIENDDIKFITYSNNEEDVVIDILKLLDEYDNKRVKKMIDDYYLEYIIKTGKWRLHKYLIEKDF